jgi:hypothetical protein
MSFQHFNRRLHLYLALVLLPWFLMYGVSSVVFAHNRFFDEREAASGVPLWTVRSERTLDVPIPEDEEELRSFGAGLLREAGVETKSFGTYRPNDKQLFVYSFSFWKATQLRYSVDQKKLTVEDKRFRWDHFLTGMHARGGFEQEGVLEDSWSVIVDIVCVGIVLWIATGLYMWWGVRGHRALGWIAIASGVVSFVWFASRL